MAKDPAHSYHFLPHEFDDAHATQAVFVLNILARAIARDDESHATARLSGEVPHPVRTRDREYPTVKAAMARIGRPELDKALAYVRHSVHVLEVLTEE